MNIFKNKLTLFCMMLFIYKANVTAVTFTTARFGGAVLQVDGKVVGGGTATIAGVPHILVARYTSAGLLDGAFGTAGLVTTLVGDETTGESVRLQMDGKMVVAGSTLEGGVRKFVVARYTTAGALDGTFNGTGTVTTALAGPAFAHACAIQADGKIVAAGVTAIDGNATAAVVRYNAGGSLDGTFGTGGIVTTSIGAHGSIDSVVIQIDGKIVVAGFAEIGGSLEVFLARYLSDGTLDGTFGTGGISTPLAGSVFKDCELALQTDGKIVLVASSGSNLAVARLNTNGALDATFATGGVSVENLGNNSAGFAVAVQPDDKIIAAGFADNAIVTVRYSSAGVLDAAFGVGGIVRTLVASSNEVHAVLVQADDKIVVVGSTTDGVLVARYETNGLSDDSFGEVGVVNVPSGAVEQLVQITRIVDVKPIGIDGGTFTSGSWQTRELNVVRGDTSIASVSGNQFTLEPGIYGVFVWVPAYRVGKHQVRLMNVTDGFVESVGSGTIAPDTDPSPVTVSSLQLRAAIGKPTTYEVQHRCEITRVGDGYGVAMNFDDPEVYTKVLILKRVGS